MTRTSTRVVRYVHAGSRAGVLMRTAVLSSVPQESLGELTAPTDTTDWSDHFPNVRLNRSTVKRVAAIVVGSTVPVDDDDDVAVMERERVDVAVSVERAELDVVDVSVRVEVGGFVLVLDPVRVSVPVEVELNDCVPVADPVDVIVDVAEDELDPVLDSDEVDEAELDWVIELVRDAVFVAAPLAVADPVFVSDADRVLLRV